MLNGKKISRIERQLSTLEERILRLESDNNSSQGLIVNLLNRVSELETNMFRLARQAQNSTYFQDGTGELFSDYNYDSSPQLIRIQESSRRRDLLDSHRNIEI
jgi:hypothetical protein